MRRRGLLIVLWLVGTTLATGVVFQAVKVMTDGLSNRSNQAGRGTPSADRSTTTVKTTSSVSSSSARVTTGATTVLATTVAETTTEPSTAPEVPSSEDTSVEAPPPGSSNRGTTRTTSARGGTSPTATNPGSSGGTTPAPTSPPVVQTAPPNPPTNPPTAAPTNPPTPTTVGQISPPSCEPQRYRAGPNTFTVRRCKQNDPPYRVFASDAHAFPGLNYAGRIVSPGPDAEAMFTGPSTWTCRAGPDETGVAWVHDCFES